jgi:hypothetical protein
MKREIEASRSVRVRLAAHQETIAVDSGEHTSVDH